MDSLAMYQWSSRQFDINHRRLIDNLKFLSIVGIFYRVIGTNLNFVRVGEHERLTRYNSSDDLTPSINKHKCALEDLHAYIGDA